MSKKTFFVTGMLVILMLSLGACAQQATEAPTEAVVKTAESVIDTPVPTQVIETEVAVTEDATQPETAADTYALKISGLVTTEMGWSEDEVKAMNTLDVESTNSKGEKATYTGVLLSDLLQLAAPTTDATTVVFVADDGFTAEAALADVMNCADCILSFRSNGGFSSVLPAFEKSLQVKGVVEIQVK